MSNDRTSALARVAFLTREATRTGGLLGTATAYHLATGGGARRMTLALDCCAALGVPWTRAAALATVCELVHQASIVHDDAQDGSALRRARPSVAYRFGVPVAICVGDHLLAKSFGLAAQELGDPALICMLACRISEMAAAQAEEFAPTLWADATLERYRAIACGKAGAALAMPVEGAALLAGLSEPERTSARLTGEALGVFYQVCDDTADLVADLGRGALNGLLAYALEVSAPPERARVRDLLVCARRNGLAAGDAASEALRLQCHAAGAAQWARTEFEAAARDVAPPRLAVVLVAYGAALAAQTGKPASAHLYAA